MNKTCPECHSGNLVVKTGRFGNFTACSNYPNCKFAAWKKEDVIKANEQK